MMYKKSKVINYTSSLKLFFLVITVFIGFYMSFLHIQKASTLKLNLNPQMSTLRPSNSPSKYVPSDFILHPSSTPSFSSTLISNKPNVSAAPNPQMLKKKIQNSLRSNSFKNLIAHSICQNWPEVALAIHASTAVRLIAAMNAWGPLPGHSHRCIPLGNDTGIRIEYLAFGTIKSAVQAISSLHQLLLKNNSKDSSQSFAAFAALVVHFPNAQWYIKSDDDTLFVMERLAQLLLDHISPNKAIMAGCLLGNFFSGGAGYILPRVVLHKILPFMATPQCNEPNFSAMEDVQSLRCVQISMDEKVKLIDVPGMWMSLPENSMRFWGFLTSIRAYALPISFHHLLPEDMNAIVTPSFPKRVLHLVWLSRPLPNTGCKIFFEKAGWDVHIWSKDNTILLPFWFMYGKLSDDAFDRLVGTWAVLTKGGVWFATEALCSHSSPQELEAILFESTQLFSLPSPNMLQSTGGPLNVNTFVGQCAVIDDENDNISPNFLACTVRADAPSSILRLSAFSVAQAGAAMDDFKLWEPSSILPLRESVQKKLSFAIGGELWTQTLSTLSQNGSKIWRLPSKSASIDLPQIGAPFSLWNPRRKSCMLNNLTSNDKHHQRYVTTWLRGGLGNQLFMISAALAYALRTDRCLFLPKGELNPHRLASWPYSHTIFSRFLVKDSFQVSPDSSIETFEEIGAFNFTEFPESTASIVRLVGYFQHQKYHISQREVLFKALEPPEAVRARLYAKYPGLASGVAIHVRRGDFLNYGAMYPIPSINYYNESVNFVLSAYDRSEISPTFFIFSNDFEWVKRETLFKLLPGTVVFVDEEDEVISLYMMSLAELGIVCANSSFCWWAILLGSQKRPATVPEKWYVREGVDVSGVFIPGVKIIKEPSSGGSITDPGE